MVLPRSAVLVGTLLFAVSSCIAAGLPLQAREPHAGGWREIGDRNARQLVARQAVNPDALASASAAESVYENQGTTAFSTATAVALGGTGACPVGFQSYTDAAGDVLCCAGSIVNNRCFQDGGTLVYTLDPYSVIAAGGTAAAAATTVPGVAATASVTRSINTSTITSYVPVATGGTRNNGAAGTTSTSYSRLSQTLTPTGGNAPTVKSANAAFASQRPLSAYAVVAFALSCTLATALVGGGMVLM
ncbi:unnamed protein product [Parajaminaea phylloscopi]